MARTLGVLIEVGTTKPESKGTDSFKELIEDLFSPKAASWSKVS